MKKLFKIVGICYFLMAIILVASCSGSKTPCYSTKFVDVTFITKSGGMYTIPVPYCDTIKLFNDKVPDSVKAVMTGY